MASKALAMAQAKDDDYREWEVDSDCCTVEKAVALMADKKKWPKILAKLKQKRKTLDDVESFMRSAQKDE